MFAYLGCYVAVRALGDGALRQGHVLRDAPPQPLQLDARARPAEVGRPFHGGRWFVRRARGEPGRQVVDKDTAFGTAALHRAGLDVIEVSVVPPGILR